jgi:hypothetical protein
MFRLFLVDKKNPDPRKARIGVQNYCLRDKWGTATATKIIAQCTFPSFFFVNSKKNSIFAGDFAIND